MNNFDPSQYSPLFDEIKSLAGQALWNKAVNLVRTSTVTLLKLNPDGDIEIRVELPSTPTAINVRLSPSQQLWECNSLSDDDPSLYVLIGVIAVKNNYLKAETPRWIIGYYLRTENDQLIIGRAFIHPDYPARPIRTLAAEICNNPDYLISRSDLTLDQIIDFGKPIDGAAFRAALSALAEGDTLFLDGVRVNLKSSAIDVGILIEDHPKGYRVGRLLPALSNESRCITPFLWQVESTLVALNDGRLPTMTRGDGTVLGFHQADILFNTMIPKLREHFDVSVTVAKIPRFVADKPRLVLLADKRGNEGVWLSPQIVYGDPVIAEVKNGDITYRTREFMIHRDSAAEQRILSLLPVELSGGQTREFQGAEAVALIAKTKEHIADTRSITHLIPKVSLKPVFKENSNDSTIYFAEKPDSPESAVSGKTMWEAYSEGYGVIKLNDGSWADIPQAWLNTIAARGRDLLEALLCKSVNPGIATRLAPIFEQGNIRLPAQWEKFLTFLGGTLKIAPLPLPKTIAAIVRPYQRDGIQWAHALHLMQVGCLLADDMGLGKTLQTLSVIPKNTLIIAPTSVLGSWWEQCQRLRPELTICLYHGPQRTFSEQADVYITSFTLVRSDSELRERHWDAIVIDEAHMLKNSQSLTFQAVHSLKSTWRIALTGTPIENSLQDLWSQFSLLNPGLLPPFDSFKDWSLEKIRSVTRPFILRRTKEQVAKDLPPKTEIILKCTLSEEEQTTYDAILLAAQQDLTTEDGVKLSALQILEALLRLRQACCHPGLIADNYLQHPSAKVELLMESLTSSLNAGHPALVFSQWVGLLNIVAEQLKAKGIAFARLDGSTKDRQAVVNEFQNPDGPPVMLISLKAGGVGLTLTRAEHVYLLDPWWNPAVEEQAADRAHRIGQKNPVFVYKLIAENTIEEQVLVLQERKLALANQILAAEVDVDEGAQSQGQLKWSLEEMRALLGLKG